MAYLDREKDEQILTALHLREFEGLTMEDVGQRVGMTKNAVIGSINRVLAEIRKTDNGHQNGTMGPMWWKKDTGCPSCHGRGWVREPGYDGHGEWDVCECAVHEENLGRK